MAGRRSFLPVPARLLVLLWITSSTLLLLPASLGYELTAANVGKAVDAIKQLAETAEGDAAVGTKYKLFIAGFIRLAFHSCVGARCVGCLNVDDPSNNGLNASVTALEGVRQALGFNITRGDLWALAAGVAFRVGVVRSGGDASGDEANAVRFRYGREDCDTAPYTHAMETFPDKRWGIDDALKYFGERGFDAREFAALMGFHTLGVVRDGPSRVVGQWVATPDRINNQFYQDLKTQDWAQRATIFNATGQADTVYTWERSDIPSRIMINTDVAVLRNFSVADSVTGRSGCNVMSTCPVSMTSSHAEQFAGNATLWRLEAAHALTKLIERGYSNLKEPTLDPVTTPDPVTTLDPVTTPVPASPTTPGAASATRRSALAVLCGAAVAVIASKSSCRE